MAEFIRPEAKATLWKYREALFALGVAAFGIWVIVIGHGVVPWIGAVFVLLGAVLLVAGVQRARFRQGDNGPGVVQITERRLTYFGPLNGGGIDVGDIMSVGFDPTGHPAPYWVLRDPQNAEIAIPVSAKGAEMLFDTFALLPGMQTDAVLQVLETPPNQRVVIWSRSGHILQ